MTFQDYRFLRLLPRCWLRPRPRVITARNPVHSALLLVLAFFTSSGLWLLLQAEFLAITLVLVYVGAVMVLFLFVVMMLDINLAKLREGFWELSAAWRRCRRPDGARDGHAVGGTHFWRRRSRGAGTHAVPTTATPANSVACFIPTMSIRSRSPQ